MNPRLDQSIEAPRSRTLYATIKDKTATALAKHFQT